MHGSPSTPQSSERPFGGSASLGEVAEAGLGVGGISGIAKLPDDCRPMRLLLLANMSRSIFPRAGTALPLEAVGKIALTAETKLLRYFFDRDIGMK